MREHFEKWCPDLRPNFVTLYCWDHPTKRSILAGWPGVPSSNVRARPRPMNVIQYLTPSWSADALPECDTCRIPESVCPGRSAVRRTTRLGSIDSRFPSLESFRYQATFQIRGVPRAHARLRFLGHHVEPEGRVQRAYQSKLCISDTQAAIGRHPPMTVRCCVLGALPPLQWKTLT